MNEKVLDAFREVVSDVTQHHGKPPSLVDTPVRLHNSTKVSAVWLIKGINHGISITYSGRRYLLDGWSHDGYINTVSISFQPFADVKRLLHLSAQMVDLLPKDND